MITRVKFTMHDGKEIFAEIDNYDAKDIENMLNQRDREYISYGDAGFYRTALKYYEPVKDEVEEDTVEDTKPVEPTE